MAATRRRHRGGFTPTIMGGVMRVGSYAMTAAVAQGSRLLRNNSKRMSLRRSTGKGKGRRRVRVTRRNKRSFH